MTNPNTKPETMLSSLNSALRRLLSVDPRVILLGEDIVDPYGGAFKVTSGLSTGFPDRVFPAPISEPAIVGAAVGMALAGLRPVVELMFGDFLTLAADQVINHACKYRWMYNNTVCVPLVIRTPMGGRRGYGPTHSQTLEKHFIGTPGLTILAPHLLGDPGELLWKAVLEYDDPVLFIENKINYSQKLLSPPPHMELSGISKPGDIFPSTLLQVSERNNADALILTYGGMAPHGLEAAIHLFEKEGLAVDLAIITQVSPPPISQVDLILRDRRPGIIAFVEEGGVMGGWGAEMLAICEKLRQGMDDEMGPPVYIRIGAENMVIPSSREKEEECLPQAHDIIENILCGF